MLKISVIIPYYQRQEGTLHRTLASIASQSALPCITEVIVIDDGSPIPAESELSALPEALSNKLRVIKQENAGVSKARNKGLDSVADGIDIVAFLDSDDNWQQGHIQHMVQAFENGADFYFANFCQLNQDIDAFSRGGRMQLHEHAALTDILHTYQGDMSTQILTGNLIGTSTVGYRFTKYQSNRFREDLKFAGEDYLFWLEIALSNPSIMFTSTVQVVYGEGVNIFSSAQWGTTHLQQRLRDEIFFRSSTLKDYPVAEQTEQELTKRLKENCKQFFSNAKSCLKHGEISAMFIVLSTVVKKAFYYLARVAKRLKMESQNNRCLYVAFHYPPILGSSGVHRTLAFTRHLAENDWDVDVLTGSLKAYDRWEASQLSFIPEKVNVIRAFGRNTAKHLSIKGKYLGLMALPDNWQSWIFGGVISGLFSTLRNRPDILVSTYPIASAHIIAYVLHKLSGIPWVADLRDPMAQEGYPSNPRKKRIFQWLERKMVKHCHHIILTTPGAKALYVERFPETSDDKWKIVPNGYDIAMFESLQTTSNRQQSEKIILLHSGVVYPSERDPKPLFHAISALKKSGQLTVSNFELRLRATGHDAIYQPLLAEMNIEDIVKLEAPVPFHDALKEMIMVDGLLLMQAANCDYQIPAKAYEYIRVGKPIFALTTEQGDTGQLMAKQPNSVIAPLDDASTIEHQLMNYLKQLRNGELAPLPEEEILRYSRQYHASSFEACLQHSIRNSI